MREREDGSIIISDDEFGAVIKSLPNNKGIRCELDPAGGDGFRISFVSPEDLEAIDADPAKFTVVCMAFRPGWHWFSSYLEHAYFPVDTPENDELTLIHYKWADMTYFVLTIPYNKKYLAYEVAEKTNMRLAEGVPIMISGDDDNNAEFMGVPAKVFPMNSRRTMTLENQSGSMIYEGRGGEQDERHSEQWQVQQILDEVRRTGRYTPK